MNRRTLISLCLCACIFLLASPLRSEETAASHFADVGEAATWQWILKRSDRQEHVERDRNGKVKWIGFYDVEKQRGDYYSGSLTFDDNRHVVQMTFNAAHFTDGDLKRIAGFTRLKKLTAWHNGWDKSQDKSVYSGAGLAHLIDLPLEEVNFGGSWFNDEGLAAAAKLPHLRELQVYHTRVTDAGVKALRNHPSLRRLVIGPQFSQKVTSRSLADIATIPHLETLEFNEALLPWHDGLEHLLPRQGTLTKLKFDQAGSSDEELAKLKAALPAAEIEYTPARPEHLAQMRRQAAKP